MGIDHQQHAINHFHDPLDFAAEISMTWGIHDVDAITVPLKGGVLRANRNALLPLQIHRIHDAFLDLLIGAERPRLPQELIDQRCLAVVNVRNDGNVTDFIHFEAFSFCRATASVASQQAMRLASD